MNIRTIAATVAASAVLAGTALTATPAEASTFHAPKGCPVSSAWHRADRAERIHAKRAYLTLVGSWNNGSMADLRNSYRGNTSNTVHVPGGKSVLIRVKGADVILTEEPEPRCF